MKQILCFGDSNTWGYDPTNGGRYPYDVRWTGRLQQMLPDCRILECGHKGRTTVFHDDLEPGRVGYDILPIELNMHEPLDLLVIMLGTNDCKRRLSAGADEIAKGLEMLIRLTRSPLIWGGKSVPKILAVAPIPMDAAHIPGSDMESMFDAASAARSARLAQSYRAVCERYGVAFWDAFEAVPHVTSIDGVHLSPADHAAFAQALAPQIEALL